MIKLIAFLAVVMNVSVVMAEEIMAIGGDELKTVQSSMQSFMQDFRWPPVASERILCESQNRRHTTCPASGLIAEVELIDRHSSAPCREGESWGYHGSVLWVDKGCRATFEVMFTPPPHPDQGEQEVIRCESSDYRYSACRVRFRVAVAELIDNLSGTRCEEGRNWGVLSDDSGIWVDEGCRGVFRLMGRR